MTGDSPWLNIEIRVKGQIDKDWKDWLEDLTITHSSDGSTLLRGTIPDQATLHGLLSRLSSLGLQLISVSYGDITRGGKEA